MAPATTQLFSSGFETASFLASSGLLSSPWNLIAHLSAETHPNQNLFWKKLNNNGSDLTTIAFGTTLKPVQPDLFRSTDMRDNPFEFLCSTKNPNFSLNKSAVSLFNDHRQKLDQLKSEIDLKKPVIVTGHGVGGSIASLFTLWLIEKMGSSDKCPLCITFGSPLIGDKCLQEAISQSSKWNSCFLHVASHRDPLVSSFISDDSYRPFGTFLLCSDCGSTCSENPDSSLRLLKEMSTPDQGFHQFQGYGNIVEKLTSQPICKDSDVPNIPQNPLQAGLALQLQVLGFSNSQLSQNNLVKDLERQEVLLTLNKRQRFIPHKKLYGMKIYMAQLEWYKKSGKRRRGYYDIHKDTSTPAYLDSAMLVTVLNNYWKSTVEEVDKEPQKGGVAFCTQWLYAGTSYRRMVEPLDIAQYYREGRKDYINKGRSEHYKLLQTWQEEEQKKRLEEDKKTKPLNRKSNVQAILTWDSCFWAHVEEAILSLKTCEDASSNVLEKQEAMKRLDEFEEYVYGLLKNYTVSLEIFLEGSTYMRWWNDYIKFKGSSHRSSLADFMTNYVMYDYENGEFGLVNMMLKDDERPPPRVTAGLDGRYMEEVKAKLLDAYEQVLNLYRPGGSGKTTMAGKPSKNLEDEAEGLQKGLRYKSTREILELTIKDLGPLVEGIGEYVKDDDLQSEEIEALGMRIKASQEVLDKYKIHWWNFFLAPCFQAKIDSRFQPPLLRYCSVKVQEQILWDSKKIRYKRSSDDDSQSTSPQRSTMIRTQTFKVNVEIFPEFTVGLDGPFMMVLKSKLLRGNEQVLNLYGLAGCGKTTLAKKLCRDREVKGKFETIFETLGSQFQGNEAIKDLQDRLGESRANPVLLILDDVWPASANFVEEFRIRMSAGSKIFVTSRVPIKTTNGTRYPMQQLSEYDAVALFLHFIQPSNNDFDDTDIRNIVLQIVDGCQYLPLALEFIGRELRDKGTEELQKVQLEWSGGQNVLDLHSELLDRLQKTLDLLVDESIRECFMDLGLFPKDQNIPVSALIDIWTELHNLDEQGIYAMTFIHKLIDLNLTAGIKIGRTVGRVVDNYYNNHFLMQHDIFRELAIRMINQEPFEDRTRLIVDMNGNHRPDWWPQQQQQQEGITGHILSYFTKWFKDPNQKRVSAPILSISTDQNINPDWCNIQADDAIVMVLNLKTTEYTLPEFIKKMRNLRVLIVTNYGFRPTKLNNVGLLESLWTLKRIRVQGVSVPPLCRLKNVCKLSLYMCEVKWAFERSSIAFSKAMPNLVDLNIEYCKDLVKLPAGLSDAATLKKLSISHCDKFTELPHEIGKLRNLELLRISYCSGFEKMPESITKLRSLMFLDISNCVSLRELPDNIGELRNLRKFYMPSCPISELPDSIMDLTKLENVICDENSYPLWEVIKSWFSGLNIKMATMDIGLNWLP